MTQPARNPERGRASPPYRQEKGGFTLVELLAVVVIIAILAGIALGALNAARESARVAKTKATIAKIDSIITEKYESYLTRRISLSSSQLQTIASGYTNNPRIVARAKMNALRDLVRMEMPDRWNDVVNGDNNATLRPPLVSGMPTPSLAWRYWRAFQAAKQAGADRATLEKYGPAECLYQIVMSDPETATLFQDDEIGDADGDGLKEFHDAWGHPIMFIRWPAGFIPPKADTNLQTTDGVDPFDPQQILSDHYPLFPLIYSAGPDGMYDISLGVKQTGGGNHADDPFLRYGLTAAGDVDVYTSSTTPKVGEPLDYEPVDGSDNWLDNIHNHRQGGR